MNLKKQLVHERHEKHEQIWLWIDVGLPRIGSSEAPPILEVSSFVFFVIFVDDCLSFLNGADYSLNARTAFLKAAKPSCSVSPP